MDNKIKYLEMIQNIINRMAKNSFMLKGWAVTLVAGIFVLAEKDTDKMYFLVTYIPVVIFWALDAYYLLQERLYRNLYEKVCLLDNNEIDFSLKAGKKEFWNSKNNFCSCFISVTELCFYLPIAIVCTGVVMLTHLS